MYIISAVPFVLPLACAHAMCSQSLVLVRRVTKSHVNWTHGGLRWKSSSKTPEALYIFFRARYMSCISWWTSEFFFQNSWFLPMNAGNSPMVFNEIPSYCALVYPPTRTRLSLSLHRKYELVYYFFAQNVQARAKDSSIARRQKSILPFRFFHLTCSSFSKLSWKLIPGKLRTSTFWKT